MKHRLAADIGGTFTDLVLFDEESGELHVHKTPSTPEDFTVGVLTGIGRTLDEKNTSIQAVDAFVHGATVVLNALLQRKLPKTGLITTRGFRDVLEIMRTNNPRMYDLRDVKPAPLVPRRLRLEVRERVRHTGEVRVPLDEGDVRDATAALVAEGVDAVAVCLLHAYANPDHERRVKEILEEEIPGIVVCLSSDIAPEWREFERSSTTCVNAATVPIIASYLDKLVGRLQEEGLRRKVLVMQSNGGMMTAEAAREWPVRTVMSGPSGGVVGALHLADEIGSPNLVTVDIGGTSSDMGVIAEGRAIRVDEGHIERWPILAPMIEILSVGAGGGSVAWLDAGHALRVGPQSAGADPGPACYGGGGNRPTVTDANLILGRIDPGYFLAGEMALDTNAAEKALAEQIAEPLGMDLVEAADGVVRIVNTNMAKAMRSILIERGYDPREFVLMAFGGAGGLHAGELLRELGIPRAVVPNNPGALSAIGMLATDFRHDRSRTYVKPLEGLDSEEVASILAELEAEAAAGLAADGVDGDLVLLPSVDLRYVGQEYHLNVPLDARDGLNFDELAARFHSLHERTYGYATPGFPVQLVNVRLAAIGRSGRPALPSYEPRNGTDAGPDVRERRLVYFAETGFAETPIFDVEALRPNDRLTGPAVVEDPRSTVVVLPGQSATVDHLRNLVITEPAP
jgi:N-methylhydantoinase A